ncbi:MAG: biotin-dependent carboxyltransferase family protein [Hyphomonadaceae bacterium]|nr:biotin-dependent carboxyltransferase family protein [Hyphomonadaceae bacterium]
MSLIVSKPGLQTTLQGALRRGYRHMGVPWAGPADPLSMALANRLVGNGAEANALEITLGGFSSEVTSENWIALTGAPAPAKLNGQAVPYHHTLHVKTGDRLELGAPARGVRTYLAIAGGFEAERDLGSGSTYLPAQLGGYQGRALQAGDTLKSQNAVEEPALLSTPADHRPHIGNSHTLRATHSAETDTLSAESQAALFDTDWTASRAASRMGVRLEGPKLTLDSDGQMPSAPVLPGLVQCAEDGQPILLMSDGQTTGGYPRIAAVLSCDLHLMGQIRPGDRVRFLARDWASVAEENHRKAIFLREWLAA